MHINSQSHISPVLKHCIILDEEEDSHGQTGCNSLKKQNTRYMLSQYKKAWVNYKIAREFAFAWLAVTRSHIRTCKQKLTEFSPNTFL